jgi:hypothetical protein
MAKDDPCCGTSEWLRELDAVRPMSTASDEVLVLGKFHNGHYPIKWVRFYDRITRDFNGRLMNKQPIESWYLFGIQVTVGLDRTDVERILNHIQSSL